MKIVCSADFHGRRERYTKFFNAIKELEPELAIIAGDIGNIDESVVPDNATILAVHGNMDGRLKFERIKMIDGEIFEYGGMKIAGFGGENPEREYLTLNGERIPIEETEFDIIVSHVPPYRLQDKSFLGWHIGNKWLLELIERKKPLYLLCGHVHENPGYTLYNKTYVINCSVGRRGDYVLIDNGKIEMVGYM
ncbi:MAG: metallophosphoesterase family protein [Thermoplasmata archaeon]|nr:metallophosphoesterase family protein [Thermoplasmata archaeon]